MTEKQRTYILRCYWRSDKPKYVRGIAKDLGLDWQVVNRVITAQVEADARMVKHANDIKSRSV